MLISSVTAAVLLAVAAQGPFDPGADIPRAAAGTAPEAIRVPIEGWLAAERHADFARAADYFAIPARVQNGGPEIELVSRRAVEFWNRSLPCGAVLTRLDRAPDGWAVATFRLV